MHFFVFLNHFFLQIVKLASDGKHFIVVFILLLLLKSPFELLAILA